MEAPHIVGVGGLPIGAVQPEGVGGLHGTGLLGATGAPVWVTLWDGPLAEELEQAGGWSAVEISREEERNL